MKPRRNSYAWSRTETNQDSPIFELDDGDGFFIEHDGSVHHLRDEDGTELLRCPGEVLQ